jgi:hypothetical protein
MTLKRNPPGQQALLGIDGFTPEPLAGAVFDATRAYRYRLWRTWDIEKPRILWCMLNPSVADEVVEDPTIRRVISFSRAWGAGGVVVCNLFALRSTDPSALRVHEDPVGPENDAHILAAHRAAARTICAWGTHGAYRNRDASVIELLQRVRPLECLRLTKDLHPQHPLYVPGDVQPKRFP